MKKQHTARDDERTYCGKFVTHVSIVSGAEPSCGMCRIALASHARMNKEGRSYPTGNPLRPHPTTEPFDGV